MRLQVKEKVKKINAESYLRISGSYPDLRLNLHQKSWKDKDIDKNAGIGCIDSCKCRIKTTQNAAKIGLSEHQQLFSNSRFEVGVTTRKKDNHL